MIFRESNKKLYKIELPFGISEYEFLAKQKSGSVNFIKVDENKLPKTDKYIEIFYELDKDNNIVIDVERCEKKLKEITQERINDAYSNLQKLCDTKSKEAKNYIAGHNVTDEQLARYEEKYQIAKEYLANKKHKERLALEAKLKGISVDELANLIVKKGDEYKEALITFNARIEAFRVKVADLIENGEIDKANEIIKKAQKFGADATDEDIAKLFED